MRPSVPGDDSAATAVRPTRAPLVAPAALLLLVCGIFATGLPAGFVFDDHLDIVQNPAATAATFFTALPTTVRPLLKASYALNSAVHGAFAPGYRLVNIALHLLTTLLVFVLIGRVLGAGRAARAWVPAALAGAALWALHPSAVDTVTYISGRSVGLSSALLIGAFLLSTAGRRTSEPDVLAKLSAGARCASAGLAEVPEHTRERRQARPRRSLPGPPGNVGGHVRPWGAALGAGFCAFLAPLARETALILPALLVLWQVTVAPRERWGDIVRRHAPIWIGVVAAAVVLALLPRQRHLVEFSLQVRGPLDALRGNLHAATAILSMWARPWAISIDPQAPVVWGWTEMPTLLRLIGVGAAVSVMVAMRRRWPVVAFAIGWTLLTLAPTNSFLWRLDPVAVRPLYLASIGPTLALVLVLARLRPSRAVRWNLLAAVPAAGVIVALASGTLIRNAQYRSPVALWEDAVKKSPGRSRPRVALALAYMDAGRLDAAEQQVMIAVDREPWDQRAACVLDAVRIRRGASLELAQDSQGFVNVRPEGSR